jgi:hypothetical protein
MTADVRKRCRTGSSSVRPTEAKSRLVEGKCAPASFSLQTLLQQDRNRQGTAVARAAQI